MRKRTLFYAQPLLGQGTEDVESLRSYIERLALNHHMKPQALLHTLLEHYPPDSLVLDLQALTKRWGVHGFSETGSQLQARLETATESSLAGATLERFEGLFSSTNLTRRYESMYCPCCIDVADGLPFGRLLWEVQSVTACPIHRVRLQSTKACGALPTAQLRLVQRPAVSGVCSQCGSIGFKCLYGPPAPATEEEVWVAQQVGQLLALSGDVVQRCSEGALRANLMALVNSVYGGSVVRAAREAGLSRASVCTWTAGTIKPGLPGLLQLCFHAGADIRSLIGAPFDLLPNQQAEPSKTISVVQRSYRRAELDDGLIAELLTAAATEADPPSLVTFAERHGLHHDTPRKRFPREASLVANARTEHLRITNKQREQQAVRKYRTAVKELAQQGKAIHSKSVQQQSGLAAFSQNAARTRALKLVLEQHTAGVVRKKRSPVKQPSTSGST